MEHDAHAPPPAAQELGVASASASVVDDWARDEDTEPMAVDPHHAAAAAATASEDGEGVADAAPPAAPAEGSSSSFLLFSLPPLSPLCACPAVLAVMWLLHLDLSSFLADLWHGRL